MIHRLRNHRRRPPFGWTPTPDSKWLAGILEDPQALDAFWSHIGEMLDTAVDEFNALQEERGHHQRLTASCIAIGEIGRKLAAFDAAYAAATRN